MAKQLIKNDAELTGKLKEFLERLETKCNKNTPEGLYLAYVLQMLSSQTQLFFSQLEVNSYGRLKTFCKNDLPNHVAPDNIFFKTTQDLDMRREALSIRYDHLASFASGEHAKLILSPQWSPSNYGITVNENAVIIGKRHPYMIAREALKHAARLKTDSLYDKTLWAIECYIDLDTSLFEVFRRVKESYYEAWKETELPEETLESFQKFAEQFDPYGKHFNPEMDYRHKEKAISTELVIQLNDHPA